MERNEREHLVLAAVFVALAVATVYLPALEGGFINWDDPDYVTANPHIRDLSWSTVRAGPAGARAGISSAP